MYSSDIKLISKPLKYKNSISYYINEKNYSDSFGRQWNKFPKTQIDDFNNIQSYDRFFNETGLHPNDFKNKKILEIGSGAGRFTNIILNHTEGIVYSVDSSDAVIANYENNKKYINKRLFLFKASLYQLPFSVNQFDIVICFGVIQHTPDIKKTIDCLCQQVKKNSILIVDFYPYNGFWTLISAKYILRYITKRLSFNTNYYIFKKSIKYLITIYFFLEKVNLSFLNRFVPIADISKTIPKNLNPKQLEEMVLLDTVDMFTPKYDRPQKILKISKLISSNNFNILFAGKINYKNLTSTVIRGKKN